MAIEPGEDIVVSDMNELMPPGTVLPYAGSSAPTGFLMCDGAAVSRTTYADLFAVISTTFGAGDGSTTFNVPDLRGRFAIGVGTGGKSIALSGVAVSSNQLTVASNRDLHTGMEVTYAGSGVTGLSAGNYFVIRVDATHIKLAASRDDAVAGTAVAISGTPSGGSLAWSLTPATLGQTGGEEAHTLTVEELAAHRHTAGDGNAFKTDGSGSADAGSTNNNTQVNETAYTGGNDPHNTLPPFVGLNYIIRHLQYHDA